MSTIVTAVTSLIAIACPGCGGVYGIGIAYHLEAQLLGHFKKCWTCPYCKQERGYGTSKQEAEIAQLKCDLEQQRTLKEEARARESDALKEADHFRKSRDGMKGQLVKVQKRVAHGVCPCCDRTFINLQRHMATKHPDYAAPPVPTT